MMRLDLPRWSAPLRFTFVSGTRQATPASQGASVPRRPAVAASSSKASFLSTVKQLARVCAALMTPSRQTAAAAATASSDARSSLSSDS